ncbi:MAG: type I addiction module toxin, SymE family [Verrucomicrobia bacterium]|nr:type I addiction module toxin, SymE family [Verrucomicrobiota bacterium]
MKSPKTNAFRTRTLKVEDQGDYGRKHVIPAVRLKGKWLQTAGLNPGQYVTVTVISLGVLELRVWRPVQYGPCVKATPPGKSVASVPTMPDRKFAGWS